jgi:hypothetical protein
LKIVFKYCFYLFLLSHISCTYDSLSPTPAKTTPLPDTVSFHKNIQPIFTNSCNNNGCHAGTIPSNRINLDSFVAYSQLMKSGSGYVDTINPTNSVIYVSVISVSNPMPPAEKLDDYFIQCMLKWIQQGAKNN